MIKKKKEEHKIVLVKSSLFEFEEYKGEIVHIYDRTGDVIVKILEPLDLAKKCPVILESANNISYI